ncbi:MAG: VWA domain-containing protein [Verrucomicrobia bacterium]|nr:VWA domain-containing protein [Verrucomicrobiota bacterium]
MKWADPDALQGLWKLILLAVVLYVGVRHRRRRLAKMADPRALAALAGNLHPTRYQHRQMLWFIAVALLFLSVARPQWGFKWQEVKRRGLDMIVVLDTSNSMLATDVKPNRLQRAKWGIKDVIQNLKGDRVGLVTFAGSAFLQCPLTIDYGAFLMNLEDVYAGIIPRGGTAISQALQKAIESFDDKTGADRVIVLITDGEDHEGDPRSLLPLLKEEKIKVYSVGVGSLEGDLIPQQDDGGRMGFLKNKNGEVVKSALQESALQDLALATGGSYVRSAPGDFGLDRLVEQGMANLQRDERESRMVKQYEDRFTWFIAAAMILLAVEAVWTERVKGVRA